MKLGLQTLHLARWGARPWYETRRYRPDRRRSGVRVHLGNGSSLPDRDGRSRRNGHARGVYDARVHRRAHVQGETRHDGDGCDVPASRHPGQAGHDARRPVGRARLSRYRRGVVRARTRRPWRTVSASQRTFSASRGSTADREADVERQRRPIQGQALPTRRDAELTASAQQAASADSDRWRRREENVAACRAIR